MNKRNFLKSFAIITATSLLQIPKIMGFNTENDEIIPTTIKDNDFSLPNLEYDYDALVPHFDKMTMEIHHSKHHAAYIKNLNEAIKNTPFEKMTLEEIQNKVTNKFPIIRNNGGGHYNHSLFWKIIAPNAGGEPTGKLAESIKNTFGSFEKFKEEFNKAAKNHFGSGWAWLAMDKNKKLFITSTPNQDNPLMTKINKQKGTPILCLDVWEHAYYLKYQNKRIDFINAFWNVVNWKAVEKIFDNSSK
ncbi:MAG: superoxide dismutase [Cytophagia bacterium]|nr:MAG: superoxide dismutase [Cytophagales bacterium]TAG02103.1 MAG: superoxide dismutase [Cytophagia bacterium]TAG46237.1 MAG: superoxide dismutase [Cytophagia bacterium]TAH28722.1 MAG: superoxide dismutase [Cytophagales bacterium]